MIATSQFLSDQAENSYVDALSGRFGYRRFGPTGSVPLVMVTRFRGTVDHWDPALLEVLAAERDVIVVDYPGVNLSSGSTPGTVAGLASTVAGFVDALDLRQVDLLGWSMGGYVVQDLCLNRPAMVRRLVVAASGPGAVPGTPPPPPGLGAIVGRPVNDDEDFLCMFFPETPVGRRSGLESWPRPAYASVRRLLHGYPAARRKGNSLLRQRTRLPVPACRQLRP
jgi:pimeloyl-ACP methyl ester carboxylesterase